MELTNRSKIALIAGGLLIVLIIGYSLVSFSSTKLTKATDELAMKPPYESYEPLTLLPDLSDIPGKAKTYQFSKKGHFTCQISYKLTGTYPLLIKRETKFIRTGQRKVDYFVIKPLREEHAKEVYEVAKASKEFLSAWQPYLAKQFSQGAMRVRNIIREQKTTPFKYGFRVGVFYKQNENAPEEFIGLVSRQSLDSFKDRSTDVSYWFGDPKVIKVKGAGTICAQVFFENIHYNYPKKIQSFVIVIHKDNLASIAVAKKMGARRVQDDERDWGGYLEERGETVTYIVRADKLGNRAKPKQ